MSRQPAFSAGDLAEYEAIRGGLREQAGRREQGDLITRAARREAGELLRRSKALAGRCPDLKVDITDAASLSGLSRPTLYAVMGEEPAGPLSGDWQDMADASLARMALEGYEGAEAELHARFPHVAALAAAGEFLGAEHRKRNPVPVMELLDDPSPAAMELHRLYRAHVRAIAAGRPVRAVDKEILWEEGGGQS